MSSELPERHQTSLLNDAALWNGERLMSYCTRLLLGSPVCRPAAPSSRWRSITHCVVGCLLSRCNIHGRTTPYYCLQHLAFGTQFFYKSALRNGLNPTPTPTPSSNMDPVAHILPFATPTPIPPPLLVLIRDTDLPRCHHSPLLVTRDLPLRSHRLEPYRRDVRGQLT